jgi:hypothetical protein
MCEIEGGIHKTKIVRTSHSSTTLVGKAAADSRGGVLGSRSCARCRSFGAAAVTSEVWRSHIKIALIRNDSDKEMNILQVTVVLEVPHHILLWAHRRVTKLVSVCRPRVRPRRCAPACKENCKANVR